MNVVNPSPFRNEGVDSADEMEWVRTSCALIDLICPLSATSKGLVDRYHRKYFCARAINEAIIARCEKQSWFRFIDWTAVAFTICKVKAGSFTMRQFDLLVVRQSARLILAPCFAETIVESCTVESRARLVA
ncbi:hypothetical protein ACVWZZ_004411 [Bradyrhizobium sp. LM6.10]